MKGNGDIFVKMNYKNIGELNSFIYNSIMEKIKMKINMLCVLENMIKTGGQ
ncbi:hypothetical protein [Clostridium celatum]|uniref:hypothetical protein n=1 Tax=Clostridium celatum TaxID=36834 RepID=UPI00034A4868|nr:hypothetical protein [Clostridium celatum]